MLLFLFFDSLLSTCPKKMETEKWPTAADSPLYSAGAETKCVLQGLISRKFCKFTVQSTLLLV